MILLIIVATLPLFVVLPIKDKVESLSGSMVFIGLALLVTGVLLFASDRVRRGRGAGYCHHAGHFPIRHDHHGRMLCGV